MPAFIEFYTLLLTQARTLQRTLINIYDVYNLMKRPFVSFKSFNSILSHYKSRYGMAEVTQ